MTSYLKALDELADEKKDKVALYLSKHQLMSLKHLLEVHTEDAKYPDQDLEDLLALIHKKEKECL